LTYRDFDNKDAQTNIKNTLSDLFDSCFIPIINENDTIAIDEIVFGDNDKLSAYVANLMQADLLILASDIDGLFDKNPQKHTDATLIHQINNIEQSQQYIDENTDNDLGTGGMTSKIQAAEICSRSNTQMWIVNGRKNGFISNSIHNKTPHTRFIFD
jgi:glutamate 5-kinase